MPGTQSIQMLRSKPDSGDGLATLLATLYSGWCYAKKALAGLKEMDG